MLLTGKGGVEYAGALCLLLQLSGKSKTTLKLKVNKKLNIFVCCGCLWTHVPTCSVWLEHGGPLTPFAICPLGMCKLTPKGVMIGSNCRIGCAFLPTINSII